MILLFRDDIQKIHNAKYITTTINKSLSRLLSIIQMSSEIDRNSWDHNEMEKYGLGKVRDVNLFYKLFLIDVKYRRITKLCSFVTSGFMHRDFQLFLRNDKKGINYSNLINYDTKQVISTITLADIFHSLL